MKLDSARNHMMLVNLWLSMLSISLMLAALLPSCFGMNIRHGMEDTQWAFYAVTLGSILMGGASFPYMFAYYKRAWRQQSEHELTKINRFRWEGMYRYLVSVLMGSIDSAVLQPVVPYRYVVNVAPSGK